MTLSNTAVPYYYGQFREAVLAGEIAVNQEISMQMNRIDANIRNPGIFYDRDPVEGYIRYCENELTLTDGSDLFLLPTFKLWAEDLLGWYYFVERSIYEPSPDGHGGHYVRKMVKKRLINKQYLIIARGAAKSMYMSTIQSYFLNVDRSTTHQITTAPTMKQSEEVLSPIRTSITRSKGPLFKFLTEGSLQNTTGSRVNRQKKKKKKKGIENFLGAIEQGASKMDDWIIVAASSEGTVRNSAGDTIKMELMDILKGDYINPHVSIWYYKLDDIKEVSQPEMWIKANPNLGKTVTYETYQLDVERAEKAPAARNDILAKRFGIPMEGYTYFFTYDEIQLPIKRRFFWC